MPRPRWQLLSTWKGSDVKPSETYAHHNAGVNGFGGSSYIDSLICRDRDKDVDGSLVREERLYYIQNWRHDVVALVRADSSVDCKIVERIRYDAYGRPTSFSPADIARAGTVIGPDNNADSNDDIMATTGSGAQWYNDFGTVTSSPNTVYLPDGTKNSFDYTAFYDAWTDPNGDYGGGGWGVLSGPNIDNRVGYAGYRFDSTLCEGGAANGKPAYHVRHRAMDSTTGKWLQVDPLGYVDGMSFYAYARSMPTKFTDPSGLACSSCSPIPLSSPPVCSPPPMRLPFGPCPGVPYADDPQGPSFAKGWNQISDSLNVLEELCDTCCTKLNEPDLKAKKPREYQCCSPEECKIGALAVVQALLDAWLRHYGKGRESDPEAVAGYWCYEWAKIFETELKTYTTDATKSCFNWRRGQAHLPLDKDRQPLPGGRIRIHQWLQVSVCGCGSYKSGCTVIYDDGFFDKKLFRTTFDDLGNWVDDGTAKAPSPNDQPHRKRPGGWPSIWPRETSPIEGD